MHIIADKNFEPELEWCIQSIKNNSRCKFEIEALSNQFSS